MTPAPNAPPSSLFRRLRESPTPWNVFRDERRLTIFNELFFLFIGIQQ